MQPYLARLLCGVWKYAPGPAQNGLEAGASWALSACQHHNAGSNYARLQCGRELPLSCSALHSANAEWEKNKRQAVHLHAAWRDHIFGNQWCNHLLNICWGSKKCFEWQILFRQETSLSQTRCYRLSVEWCYILFHSKDKDPAKYIESR